MQLVTSIKRVGLAVAIPLGGFAIAALSYQPAMQANGLSLGQPSPTVPSMISSPAVGGSDALLAQATSAPFVSVAHPTAGGAQIVETADGQRYLEFDSAFRTDAGPDLLVLLHSDAEPETYSPDSYVSLGQVERVAGMQRYTIPADVDIQAFRSAVIWCREFDVTFGYATL